MLGRSCGRRWKKTERLFLILNEKLKVDKTDWKRHSRPAVVNAFYSSIENSIQFPAGILQGNFFGSDRPAYMNYGGIGWVGKHQDSLFETNAVLSGDWSRDNARV